MLADVRVHDLTERYGLSAGEMGAVAKFVCDELGLHGPRAQQQSKVACWRHPEIVERAIAALGYQPRMQKETWFDRLDAKVDGDIILGLFWYGLLIATVVALVRGCS